MRGICSTSTLALLLVAGCGLQDSELTAQRSESLTAITIPMRSYSVSPTLGARATSSSDPYAPNYGALKIFMERAAEYTNDEVQFSIVPWNATAPNSIIAQVGMSGDGRDAAYDNGGALNPVWGFIYNSGTPFGLRFREMVRFLYDGGGLALAQQLIDAKGLNVKILPVLGSNPQGSGYFKAPIGPVHCEGEADCRNTPSIGLEGLCQAGWTFRYLPPAQNVIDSACDRLVAEGIIPRKNINFVQSVGGQTVLGAVQTGAVTAFEFATPLDDYDQPPAGVGFFPALTPSPIPLSNQNPGHKGLRFAHFPSWHQPFVIGWLLLNKTDVWDRLTPRQRAALERAAHDALVESYHESARVQCRAWREILGHNDGQDQLDAVGNPILIDGRPVSADVKDARWPREALDRLHAATQVYLDSLRGTATQDQRDYGVVLDTLQGYMRRMRFRYRPTDFPERCRDDRADGDDDADERVEFP